MPTFFTAIQNKFKADYHGRYLGHIIEQIAEVRPEVVTPILKNAPLTRKVTSKSMEQIVSAEVHYTDTDDKDPRRLADLEISLSGGGHLARILVEIKMLDKFLPGQLEAYAKWAMCRTNSEDRAVVVLTAYPIDKEANSFIDANKKVLRHMYLSDLTLGLDASTNNSELIQLFKSYLYEQGYAMYELKKENNDTDYKALLSFLVLNFLPHQSGYGKVSGSVKISRGPVVFSEIVKNWQLISDRLASHLNFTRSPTVRYVPQQGANEQDLEYRLPNGQILEIRNNSRNGKRWGRYWLFSHCTFKVEKDTFYVEWGQIIQIQTNSSDSEKPIECGVYSLVKRGSNQLSKSGINWLENGIENSTLYHPEKMLALLKERIVLAAESAKTNESLLKGKFPWESLTNTPGQKGEYSWAR